MQNYFNYYTQIEEHFQRRRGTLLVLSTLDWALIATWLEAGFPLEAVLRGIDATFEKHAARQAKGRVRRINGLAYCSQEVLRAVEAMHAAATGTQQNRPNAQESGFEPARIAAHLRGAAVQLHLLSLPELARPALRDVEESLEKFAAAAESGAEGGASLETLEQHLVALEEKLLAAIQAVTSAEDLMALREQSMRELAPFRSRLQTAQIRQIEQQFLRRSLFEKNHVPRLSLFHMRQP